MENIKKEIFLSECPAPTIPYRLSPIAFFRLACSIRVAAELHSAQCFTCFASGGDGVPASVLVGAALQIHLGTLEKALSFIQRFWNDLGCTGFTCCFDGLPSVAHLLHRRTRTAGQRDNHRNQQQPTRATRTKHRKNLTGSFHWSHCMVAVELTSV